MESVLEEGVGSVSAPSDTSTKTCTRCKQEFPATPDYFVFRYSGPRRGPGSWCLECRRQKNVLYMRKHRSENKEHHRAVRRALYTKNRDQILKNGTITRQRLRSEVLAAYGGVCACCGESRQDFLAIDHPCGDGAEHRKKLFGHSRHAGSRMYTWLRKNHFPSGFRVLCHNCNVARGYYRHCPHEIETGISLDDPNCPDKETP